MSKSTSVGVVFQPEIYQHLLSGFDFILNAVKPTLGPSTRITAIEREVSRKQLPEMLDDGGLIARRIIQLDNPDEDMGAMYLRHVLWSVYEKTGDGTATTAVIFHKIFTEGIRHITFGANAMRLRIFLEKGKALILEELDKFSQSIQNQKQLVEIAESICYDPELSKHLGSIYHIVGQYGRVEIREAYGKVIESEFLDGMYWDSKLLTGEYGRSGHQKRIQLEDVALLVSDINFDQPELIVPLIREILQSGKKQLILMGSGFSESVLSVLNAVNKNKENIQTIAVKCPGITTDEQAAYLQDIAMVTGAQPLITAAGYQLPSFKTQYLGYVRRAWADNDYFGIVGGQGNPIVIRRHVASLRHAIEAEKDKHLQQRHLKRLSILMGGSAVLRISGNTPLERKERLALAERTSEALRGVVGSGIVPGGGVALLACQPAVRSVIDVEDEFEERAAYQILLKALDAPIKTIIANTGFNAEEIMAEIKYSGEGYGFDARRMKVCKITEVGVWDSLSTLRTVIETAVHGAALALTIDAFIHRRKPEQAVEP